MSVNNLDNQYLSQKKINNQSENANSHFINTSIHHTFEQIKDSIGGILLPTNTIDLNYTNHKISSSIKNASISTALFVPDSVDKTIINSNIAGTNLDQDTDGSLKLSESITISGSFKSASISTNSLSSNSILANSLNISGNFKGNSVSTNSLNIGGAVGWTGTFTNGDGKTVTVVDGIIISVI